jgi:hypothetical protein
LLGLGLLVCGLLVPAHVRAVDVSVLWKAGRSTPGVSDRGLALLSEGNLGSAQLLLQAAQNQKLAGRVNFGSALANALIQHPELMLLGRAEPRLEGLTHTATSMAFSEAMTNFEPFTSLIIRTENRERVLRSLESSTRPAVQQLLACRAITNTALFSPSASASGQALDAALATCGLLIDRGYLRSELRDRIGALATEANRVRRLDYVEQVLMDLLSLGQRFNWAQLVQFVGQIEDPETLRRLTILARRTPSALPVLFTAVELSGQPGNVVRYLMDFSQSGWSDLSASLAYGTGGVKELVSRDLHVCTSPMAQALGGFAAVGAFVDFAAFYAWHNPWLALALKWLLYLASGYWLALALRQARPVPSVLELPLHVRGFHVIREMLFGSGFLVVVLLLTEPFLTQETQRVEFPFQLHLPTVGSMLAPPPKAAPSSFMNQLSLLTLMLFFVLQALLYIACLVKLAEIRRQRLLPRIKLKLLENEDHLFDAGLYLGFVGTIISLILVSLGVIRPSLMAAYSSTSFGIIFVSIFKIFHLRPLRRNLLLEAEATSGQPISTVGHPSLATSA